MSALLADDGTVIPLEVDRWHAEPSLEDLVVLDRAAPPVLDVGCGPGRHVLALAERGVMAMGVDASPAAVRLARSRGAPVLERSVFGRIPQAGRWGSALLLDGNIGIGGDPIALLRRVGVLIRRGGTVLVEVEPTWDPGRVVDVRLSHEGVLSPVFPWALVSAGDIADVAASAGLVVDDSWVGGARWFVALVHR
jgi:SAM-dependent methyltransferase